MRVLIVDTCYQPFLRAHYAAQPGLDEATYEVQWRALMDRFFGTADSYSHFLGALGHAAHEIVINCEPLQRSWAADHGVRLKKRFGVFPDVSLILAQAEDFSPDVVYVQDLNALGPKLLAALRERSGFLVGQIASKLPADRQLASFDLLLSSFPHFVARFRARGLRSDYFRIGFDPRVLASLENENRVSGAVFVGAVGRSATWHSNALLERAAERVPIDFWGYRVGRPPMPSPIRRRYHGEAWGIDMYRVLARSRIALNRHGDVAEGSANNMRLYEATGVGTLLITDEQSNLSDIFEPGEEVVTYANEDELVKKITHYLEHEAERARIAHAGQQRTLRDHSYERRMRELVEILLRYLS